MNDLELRKGFLLWKLFAVRHTHILSHPSVRPSPTEVSLELTEPLFHARHSLRDSNESVCLYRGLELDERLFLKGQCAKHFYIYCFGRSSAPVGEGPGSSPCTLSTGHRNTGSQASPKRGSYLGFTLWVSGSTEAQGTCPGQLVQPGPLAAGCGLKSSSPHPTPGCR